MFTYVTLKNFKSFEDITLDLTDKNNHPKSLVLIYGENGIGKSNLASAAISKASSIPTTPSFSPFAPISWTSFALIFSLISNSCFILKHLHKNKIDF